MCSRIYTFYYRVVSSSLCSDLFAQLFSLITAAANGCLLHSALAGRLSATTGLFIVSFPSVQLETVNWISFHLASESIVLCYLLRLNWPVLTLVFRKGLVALFVRISPRMNSSPLWSFYGWTPILYSLDYFIKRIIFLRSITKVFCHCLLVHQKRILFSNTVWLGFRWSCLSHNQIAKLTIIYLVRSSEMKNLQKGIMKTYIWVDEKSLILHFVYLGCLILVYVGL